MAQLTNTRVITCLTLFVVILLLHPFPGMLGTDPLPMDDPLLAVTAMDLARGDAPLTLEQPPFGAVAGRLSIAVLSPLIPEVGALRLTSALFSLGTLGLFFLFVRRRHSVTTALLSIMVLATMPGFAFVSTSISVDPMLTFFAMATVVATSRVFFDNHPQWAPAAGLAMAGAFLTASWLGLLLTLFLFGAGLIWFLTIKREENNPSIRHLFFHLMGVLALIALPSVWIAVVLSSGAHSGEGFWLPQTGLPMPLSELALRLVALTWPWTPLILFFGGLTLSDTIRKGPLNTETLFLLTWMLAAFLMLMSGLSHVGPLLPPMALMAAQILEKPVPGWLKRYGAFWFSTVASCLFLVGFSPILEKVLPAEPPAFLDALFASGPHTLLAIMGLIAASATWLIQPLPLTRAARLLAITAIFWFAVSKGPFSAIALEKRGALTLPAIATSQSHIATYNMDRQTRADLIFVHGLKASAISLETVYDILKGGLKTHAGVLVMADASGNLPKEMALLPCTATPLTQTATPKIYWVAP